MLDGDVSEAAPITLGARLDTVAGSRFHLEGELAAVSVYPLPEGDLDVFARAALISACQRGCPERLAANTTLALSVGLTVVTEPASRTQPAHVRLSGEAPLHSYQAVLDTITYQSSLPTLPATRRVELGVFDGALNGSATLSIVEPRSPDPDRRVRREAEREGAPTTGSDQQPVVVALMASFALVALVIAVIVSSRGSRRERSPDGMAAQLREVRC
jgi:hypothetical protein